MGFMAWGFVTNFFTYETTKSVVVKSWSVGIINRIVQLLIIAYFVGWVFIHEKAYQVTDTGIESSVVTKVKGFSYHESNVMDVADYIFPPQGTGVFCIATKLIVTKNQFQGRCAESEQKFKCTTDEDCSPSPSHTPGVITGVCLKPSNDSAGFCEIEGWCPAENDKVTVDPMDVKNFTIFIKNSIRFPRFGVTRGNIPPTMTSKEIENCTYHPETYPLCPIFRVGDVLNYTGQNVSTLAIEGGEIGIIIEWKCNLDLDITYCLPKYTFTRLDAPFANNSVSKGYNFRFAKYFKGENGTEFRTLYKVFAIRFDVIVTGIAGKFNTIPTMINLVAAFTSVGLAAVLCDVILLNCLKGAEQYKARKFEEVSEAQIASINQSSGSCLSLRPDKSSCDSGAVSLSNSDQPL
uniref:P2X purinoceptor 3a n=1 Tax=Monopterus albus TaxID=43700 RepID=UPI0009B31750|nr:P2X purinoceptor 3 [Monopterus albus]